MRVPPNPKQLKQISDALLSAFAYEELKRLVNFELNEKLAWFTPVNGTLETIVAYLVDYCASKPNGLKDLLAAACAARPKSDDLTALQTAWADLEFEPLPLIKEHPHQLIIYGDQVEGDKISGNKIAGDQTTIGDIDRSIVAAAGGKVEVTGPVYLGTQDHPADKPKPAPKDLRQIEMTYLDKLTKEYEYWAEKYTPLAGIAEVKAATQDGPRLDLPTMFMPTGFAKLEEHGFGEQRQVERKPVDDLRQAVTDYKRLVVLGEPGCGKTTTLRRLAYDYAVVAQNDETQPLPLLVPLGGYTGPEDALTFAQNHAGDLALHLTDLLEQKRIILLLDALNEMPQKEYRERVQRVQTLLDKYPDTSVIVTCRELDYVEALNLEKLEIKPLDVDRQRAYLHRYLGEEEGEKLFWAMAGGEEIVKLWTRWENNSVTWDEFWQGQTESYYLQYSKVPKQQEFIERCRAGKFPPMIELGENPYMLVMLAQVFASKGELPQNRGRTFAAFVDTLLAREQEYQETDSWPGDEPLREGLAQLAFAMQVEGERGTAVDADWTLPYLQTAECDGKQARYLAACATLLDWQGDQVRFVHQLLQEYFAAVAWQSRIANEPDLSQYWPNGWTEPSGWEETTILLAGIVKQMDELVLTLLPIHPVLAARCIGESGGTQPTAEAVAQVQTWLVEIANSKNHPVSERNAATNALVHVDDPRRGVSLNDQNLPDIVWCDVPAGSFTMSDGGNEHSVSVDAFSISRYPITNAQYAAFFDDGGYTETWQSCWTEAGWQWRTNAERVGPQTYGGDYDLPNHPVVGVSWYEAVAFCNWLSVKTGQTIQLPSEAQWEKAACGTDGRRYPWNGEISFEHCNYFGTSLGTTSAVGIFPKSRSPYDVDDMSGNVWEWTSSRYMSYPYSIDEDRENLNGISRRSLRGGSFLDNALSVRCAGRRRNRPLNDSFDFSFRVVVLVPL